MTDRAHDKDTAWTDATPPAPAPLATDHEADVCVVGAGIAGLTAAYCLTKAGKRVIVVDDGAVGGGESGLTTAHLVTALDRRWTSLAKMHAPHSLRLAAKSHKAAIDTIERIVAEEGIDCDFIRLNGYLFAGPGTRSVSLKEEVEIARQAGLSEVREVARAPLTDFDTGPAVEFPAQAQFHILKYLAGLARAIERGGGTIYTRARVIDVEEGLSRDHVILKTDRGLRIVADHAVLATNSPFIPRISVHLKQAGYRTYAIGLRVPRGAVVRALYWDTAEPFHYIRLADLNGPDSPDELLIVGGEDHRSGQAADTDRRHARLEEWAREHFPGAGEVVHRWSGQVMETADGLAYIGRVTKDSRVMIVTGDCGNGMTHGTIAGTIIEDLVHDRQSELADLYAPGRFNWSFAALSEYLEENLNTAVQYARRLPGGEPTSAANIAPGSGAVVRRGLTKIAAYRDLKGQLHERTAVCPHLGGMVAWNQAERTWDCRCHGARFDAVGRVIHGPATSDLAPLKADKAVPLDAPTAAGRLNDNS